MLNKLKDLFEGKHVNITNTNPRVKNCDGVCKEIHETPGRSNSFNLEFENGNRYGFYPEVINSVSVEGELFSFAGGRRKIEIIS